MSFIVRRDQSPAPPLRTAGSLNLLSAGATCGRAPIAAAHRLIEQCGVPLSEATASTDAAKVVAAVLAWSSEPAEFAPEVARRQRALVAPRIRIDTGAAPSLAPDDVELRVR